jgi:hypothetical protein
MNPWQRRRKLSGWSGGYVEWTEGNEAFLSVVFSWRLHEAYQRSAWYRAAGYPVYAGGPAVALDPDRLADVAHVGGRADVLRRHNPNATVTTRGCPRRCPFCAVPLIEGDLVELSAWEPRPVVCDNNLLSASRAHFDRVVDRLKRLRGVDFNQGLDARLLTPHHAVRLAELDLKAVRLAWDGVRLESQFMRAFERLRKAGIPAGRIHVYVLIGFDDSPADALYRLETVWKMGAWPNPMRYQPLDARRKNEYVAPGWSAVELARYMKYWSNLRHLSAVPFAEFRLSRRRKPAAEQWPVTGQGALPELAAVVDAHPPQRPNGCAGR